MEQFKEKWKPIANLNITNGCYLVTVVNQVNNRYVDIATYTDGVWVFNNNILNETSVKVVAIIDNVRDLEPYDKPVMKFNKGDIIVWTHPEHKTECWMIISSFDYLADNAARAVIGKLAFPDCYKIYNDFCPGYLNDDVHIATEDEKKRIYDEIVYTYYNDITMHGYTLMEMDLKKYPMILNELKELWRETYG